MLFEWKTHKNNLLKKDEEAASKAAATSAVKDPCKEECQQIESDE